MAHAFKSLISHTAQVVTQGQFGSDGPDGSARKGRRLTLWRNAQLAAILVCSQFGCATPEQTAGLVAGAIVGITVTGAVSPAHEIEQIYYLGVFDPQDQLPPQVYQLVVHGQASAISGVKFGSGWVPSSIIDSLSGHVEYNVNTNGSGLTITRDEATTSRLATGRHLIQFGPEGFREAPKDHRLVIVMGQSPQAFFEAVDQALGHLSVAGFTQTNLELERDLLRMKIQLDAEKSKWEKLQTSHTQLFQ